MLSQQATAPEEASGDGVKRREYVRNNRGVKLRLHNGQGRRWSKAEDRAAVFALFSCLAGTNASCCSGCPLSCQ